MTRRIAVALIVSMTSLHAAQAQSSFGRTAGQFGVSPTGESQYSIPIWTPPGPKGVQPNIYLAYSSRAGIGSLGIGWSIGGLGAVVRCNKTYAQDGAPANVALAVNDGYCLNGNRLRLTSGTYGTAGSTYQTEIADFSNVTANGTAGNGPANFTVQGRDGNTYEYGFTDSNGNGVGSQVLATGSTTASAWLLSKVIDRAGNNLVVNYVTLTGTAVPDTILWTPVSAGASTYLYSMKFNYTSNVPQSSLSKYISGTAVSNTELLSSIAISNSGTVIKDYFLAYQASPTTGRNELITVKECADSAQSNCLLPTSVGYQAGGSGVSATSTVAESSVGSRFAARYDFNGDGIPDLVYNPTGTGPFFVAFGSTSGYGTPINTGITGLALFGNVTGGSKDGILAVQSGVWWYYVWNATSGSFVGSSTGTAVDSASFGYQLADMDGDGLPDLIDLDVTSSGGVLGKFTATINTRRNTSSGGTASFSTTLVAAGGVGGVNSAQLKTPDSQFTKLRRYDFDGDGRDDLALEVQTGTSPNFTVKTYALVSTGTGFTNNLLNSATGSNFAPLFFVNWNDDACTDFVTGLILNVSACNGSSTIQFGLSGVVVGAMDWDGDGRTDLLVANGSTIGVYLSTGSGVGALLPTATPYSSACAYVTMDANGDGLDDLGCWSQTSPNPLSYYLHSGAGQPPDLATSFTDGYGVSYSPSYVALSAAGSAVYIKGTSQVFPYRDYDGPTYVTSSVQMPDGVGSTYTRSYSYAGAVRNVQGRGFQGFTTVNSLDSRTGFHDARSYSTLFPNSGMLMGESVTQGAGTNVSVGSYSLLSLTLDATANNERYFPYTASSSVNTYEVQVGGSYNGQLITTTAMNYGTPDIYGNFPSVVKTLTDQDSGSPYFGQQYTSTTATSITPNPATWCINLPTESDVTSTAPGVPAITRHLTLTPDYTHCRETQQVVELGNATYQVTTGYLFDAFGNISSQTVTGIGMAARTSGIDWGATGQFPATVTNALSQISHSNFDPITGKLLSIQDPNGITTSWLYDAFQRKQQETRPDGTTTTWAYNNCATAGCVNANNKTTVVQTNVNVGGTTLNMQNTYLDAFDRTLVTSKQMLNGAFDRNEVQYDNMGNVHQQGAPCTFVSCVAFWTTNTYDPLNRLLTSQRPISATNSTLQTTTIQYSGRATTTTDPQAKVTTQITKVSGKVGRTKDHNGYFVNFNHDAFGSVLSVTDSLSNTLRTMTYAYGIKAFRTSLADMDLGTRSYTPNALGEVTTYSDGKGNSFSATYDALSRKTSRTEPDLTTTWTWGATAANHNIGRLSQVQSVSSSGTYTKAFGFDSLGRPGSDTTTLPTAGSFRFIYVYDTTSGLIHHIQYPPSFPAGTQLAVAYAFKFGILSELIDNNSPTTVFWRANSTNARGQITQETSEGLSGEPQIVSGHTYDAVTGWLSTIQTGIGSGAALQNESYQYDEMGNVIQRQNNNLGLTENIYYDNLYRLDHSTLGSATNLQMGYDAMGNITSRSDVAGGASWTYDPTHKHQVTQAGSSAFAYAYDANGNVRSRNGSIIGWTSYNYPAGVGTSTESATFDYGPDRQRWRMFYSGPSGTETTYYLTPMFEVVVTSAGTDYRHYIYANGRPVTLISRTTAGAVNVRSLLADQQGSISSIVTDATGASLVSESFTAYGSRREASTWTGAPTSGELTTMNGVTREGYTFQTVLGSMGLNHMNGRIEDSVTGRFLSPDPHVPHPGSTQSYNRYSYVENNPVSRVDPTGFADEHGSPCEHCIKSWGAEWGDNMNTGSSEFDAQYGGDTKSYYAGGGNGIGSGSSGDGTSGSASGSGASGNVSVNDSAGDTSPPASGGYSSTVDVPGVGTHPATNTVSTDANGMVTIEVDIYSPDAQSSPTPNGVNTAPYWASPTFRSYQPAMNAAGKVMIWEIGVFNPPVLDALALLQHAPSISLPKGGSVAAGCVLCVSWGMSQAAEHLADEFGMTETATQLQEYSMAEILGSGLEEGSSAFTDALNSVLWGPQKPVIYR
jgi:RHS repeat-associated protein